MSRNKNPFMRVCAIAEFITYCCIPALLFGCSSDDQVGVSTEEYSELDVTSEYVETGIVLKSTSGSEVSHADIFIFNNDELKRIDAYQRVTGTDFKAASRAGEKIMVAVVNSTVERDDWRRISSYDGLMEEVTLLSDEDPLSPIMSGEAEFTATSEAGSASGTSGGDGLDLEIDRLLSKVQVKSLRADFKGTGFEGKPLTDVRIYLTNVNASCTIMRQEDFRPEMIVNYGYADEATMYGFRTPTLLCQELDEDIGSQAVDPDVSLYCYPNDVSEETYGSPFTRLVIEGKIAGNLCYYPITINREENGICYGVDGTGIGRNCLYTFDITLCRFGSSDPDTPINATDVLINCSIEPWTEKDNETITF